MKKLFTLLSLALLSISTAWAADNAISCSAYLSSTAGSPTVTDCTFKYFAQDGQDAGTVAAGTKITVSEVDYYYAKMNNDKNYYEVTLNKTVGGNDYNTFQPGDVITVYLYTYSADPGYKVGKTAQTTVSLSKQTTSTIVTAAHTLTAAEIESDGTVRIYRNSSKTYFAGISVTGKRPAHTPKWDWKNSSLSGVEGTDAAGTIDSDVAGISMNVLAAVSGTYVKLADAGDYAQFNANSAMRIPVTTTKDKVIITAYPGQYNYTVGGTAASADVTEHTATLKEVALGYVEIVATSTAYIYSVQAELYDEKGSTPQLLTFTADGTTYYPEELSWTEDPAGTFSTTISVASLPAAAPTAVAYNGAVGAITYAAGVATIPVTVSETTYNYVVAFTASAMHTITAAYADGQNSTWGTITNLGDNNVIEDEDITLTATANTGYAFVNWTKGGAEYSTNSSITITSTAGNAGTYVANFVKLYKVTYNKSTDYIGTIPTDKILNRYDVSKSINEIYADKDGNYTIPVYADKYFYRNGYTFDKWSDGVNTYDSGEAIVLTSDITLAPTWTATTATLSNSQNKNTVTWSLAKSDIVFVDWQSSDKYGNYVQKATVNGETISIPMQITKGKVGNWGRTDALAQTNQYTQFTIPAVSGMIVEIPDAYTNFSTTTIAGSTDYTGTGTKSISYTYTGSAETIDIVIGENNQYLKRIVVKYPVTAANVTISPAKEYTTYVTEAALDFTGLELKAYVATGASASEVTMEPVTTVPANTPLVLKKGSAASYDVPVIASAAAPATNKLVASDGVSSIGGDGVYDYILSNGLFYHASAGVLPAGKAYLHLDSAPAAGARELSMSFEDEATGIADVRGKMEDVRGDFFDLSGRKVAQPQKGLYIVNGKKVVIK